MANKDRAAVESGISDILGSVIQSDRRRSGRGEESPVSLPEKDIMTSPTVITEEDNKTVGLYDNNTLTHSDTMTDKPQGSPRKRQLKQEPKDDRSLLERRIEEAQDLAETSTTTVTLRIPHGLNDWLDEYVHGSWPEKVKKQQLVTEALQLLFARRGKPKEEILPTELMPEEK